MHGTENGTLYGPAMSALTEMERKFVLAAAADPWGNGAKWARQAGYSDKSDACKVRAHFLLRNPKIRAAIHEFSRGLFDTVGPLLATTGMLRIARDRKHPQHLRALEMIANRVGLHETTEHKVSVEHTDRTGRAMAERIKQLASALGMDAAQLLGVNEVEPVKMIEGKVATPDVSDA